MWVVCTDENFPRALPKVVPASGSVEVESRDIKTTWMKCMEAISGESYLPNLYKQRIKQECIMINKAQLYMFSSEQTCREYFCWQGWNSKTSRYNYACGWGYVCLYLLHFTWHKYCVGNDCVKLCMARNNSLSFSIFRRKVALDYFYTGHLPQASI